MCPRRGRGRRAPWRAGGASPALATSDDRGVAAGSAPSAPRPGGPRRADPSARWRARSCVPSTRNTEPPGTEARSRTAPRTLRAVRAPTSTWSPSWTPSRSASTGDSSTVWRGRRKRSAGERSTSCAAHSERQVPRRSSRRRAARARAAGRRAPRAPTARRRGGGLRAQRPAQSARADLVQRQPGEEGDGVEEQRDASDGASPTPRSWPARRATSAITCQPARTPEPIARRAAADGRWPGAAAARGRPGARACPPSPRRPRRGRRPSACSRNVSVSVVSWAMTVCAAAAPPPSSGAVGVACGGDRRAAGRATSGGRRRGPRRCPAAPRLVLERRVARARASRRSRPRGCRGRWPRKGARAGPAPSWPAQAEPRGDVEQRGGGCCAARPGHQPLAVEDHDVRARAGQHRGELAHGGGVRPRPPWRRRRGCRRRPRARRRARRAAPRRRRARSAARPRRSGPARPGARSRPQPDAVAAHALADAQVEDRRVVDGVAVEHEHRVRELEVRHGGLQRGVGERAAPARRGSSPPGRQASCAEPRPSRNSRCSRKASSLVVSPPASAAARPPAFFSARGGVLERLLPRRRHQAAALAHERLGDAVVDVDGLVGEASLVAQPAVVHLGVIARHHAHHAVVADGQLDVALGRAEVQTVPAPSMSHGRARSGRRSTLARRPGTARRCCR